MTSDASPTDALRALLRVFPDQVMVVGPALDILATHLDVSDALGAEAVVGASLLSLGNDGSRALLAALAEPASGATVEWVTVIDGRLKAWEARLLEGEGGAWLAVIRDMSHRRRAEISLAAEKERLTVTLRSIQDGVISTDRDGRIVLMNPAAERILGIDVSTVRSQPVSTTLWELAKIPVEQDSDGSVFTVQDVAGRTRHVRLGTFPVLQHGQLLGAVYTLRDVTEERSAEAERLRASKLESVGLLAGGIAHDFNNLLASIMGNTAYIRHAFQQEELNEILDDVDLATARATNLTRQLLTFAKGGAPMTAVGPVDQVVREAVEFGTRGSPVRPMLRFDDDLHVVDIDQGQMQSVLQSLVINACQAMPGGGRLIVEARNVDELPEPLHAAGMPWVEVAVIDEGIGIPEADKTRIFDPYFTTKPKGSGLGLASAYAVVRKHGGHLTVDSALGEGSTFHIFLPAVAGATALPAAEDGPLPRLAGRVLVVDDEATIRAVAERLCRLLGLHCDTYPDGADAVRRYREARRAGQPYDVVLLDLTVPGGMGGEEAVGHLLDIDPEAVCVATSGYATGGVLANYERYGFRGRLAKPFDARRLADTLSRLLPTVGGPPAS